MARIGEPIWPEVEYEPIVVKGHHYGYLPVDFRDEHYWMQEQFDNEPTEGIRDCFLTFPKGDGKAIYKVTSLSPLTVTPVMYGDRWEVNEVFLKNLSKADIEQLIEDRRSVDRLLETRRTA